MFEKLTTMPKCQDGRVCKGNNNGFMLASYEFGNKFVCYECWLQARNELLVLLEKLK